MGLGASFFLTFVFYSLIFRVREPVQFPRVWVHA